MTPPPNRPPARIAQSDRTALPASAYIGVLTIHDPIVGATLGRNQSTASTIEVIGNPATHIVSILVRGAAGGRLISLPLRDADADELISMLQAAYREISVEVEESD